MAALSTSMWSSSTSRVVGRDALDRLAPQARGLENVRLVHRGDPGPAVAPPRRRAASKATGRSARSRRPSTRSRRERDRRRGRCRRSRSRRSARAPRGGRCRRSRSGRSGLASTSAGLGRTGRRFAYRPRPLRRPRRPCSGRGASGSVVSHFGPPTAPSSTASAPRHASSTSSVRAVPCASIEAPPTGCSANSNSPDRVEQPASRREDLGPDPVAWAGPRCLGTALPRSWAGIMPDASTSRQHGLVR